MNPAYPLLDLSDCFLFSSKMFLFFHAEERLIFNTTQLRFYHCSLELNHCTNGQCYPPILGPVHTSYAHLHKHTPSMHTPSHAHTFTLHTSYAHLHKHTPSHAHTFTCTPTCVHTSYAHLHKHTPSQAHTFTCTHLHMHTPSHAHTSYSHWPSTHACAHTHILLHNLTYPITLSPPTHPHPCTSHTLHFSHTPHSLSTMLPVGGTSESFRSSSGPTLTSPSCVTWEKQQPPLHTPTTTQQSLTC